MSKLSKFGIPGPKPHLIFGNLFDMKRIPLLERNRQLIEKYGKIVGYYVGSTPIVLIADPELAKNILIKDFKVFSERSLLLKYHQTIPKSNSHLFTAHGKYWTKLRRLFMPAFSPCNLKNMDQMMKTAVEAFIKRIEYKSKTGESFNIHTLYQRLTADVILRTLFTLPIDPQKYPNNNLLIGINEIMDEKINKYLFMFAVCFPGLYKLIHPFRRLLDKLNTTFKITIYGKMSSILSEMVNIRAISSGARRRDLLQIMLNTYLFPNISQNRRSLNFKNKKSKFFPLVLSNNDPVYLTKNQIIYNSITLLGAGCEPTSSGLAYITHFLVNYPDVQDKVREELNKVYENNSNTIDFNSLNELRYLEFVINEAFRIYPPAVVGSSRQSLSDYKYKDIIIPNGAIVTIDTHYLHHNSDYWPEPEKFDPMRFSEQNMKNVKTCSWLPFGDGPRNCIGMQMAYMQIKMTFALLLLNYKLVADSGTELGSLDMRVKYMTTSPQNGLFVRIIKL